MEHPEQPNKQSRPQQHPQPSHLSGHEHHRANRMDTPSPMNVLWGLILTMLTFLLVIICVLSIYFIKQSAPDTPPQGDEPGTDQPGDSSDPTPPSMLPATGPTAWSPDDPDMTLTFASDAPVEDFLHVTVDDVIVQDQYFTLTSGSTVVTIHADYLAMLSTGQHRLSIHSKGGTAETTFEIEASSLVTPPPTVTTPSYVMSKDTNTVELTEHSTEVPGIYSDYAVLVDLSTNLIVAQRSESARIYPASMTKVLTLLVASEMLTDNDLNEFVVMSQEVITAMQQANASGVGFKAGEEMRVRDLLFAIALESDCAASVELARYLCDTEAAFVEKMNDKCRELGLIATNFVNASGLDDPNQYTTCREMASIMAAAMDNERVKTLLSTDRYETTTNVHGKLTFYSTYFVDVQNEVGSFISLRPQSGRVVAAKTGTTDNAGRCLVTYFESNSGHCYVAVTAGADTSYGYVADYHYMYDTFAK